MIDANIISELQHLRQRYPDSSVSVDQPGEAGSFCTIALTQGKFAIVDVEDYEYINLYTWSALRSVPNKSGNVLWYAVRAIHFSLKKDFCDGKDVGVQMHTSIMETPPGYEIHHINGNGLDNRKDNLVICTRQEHRNFEKEQRNRLT